MKTLFAKHTLTVVLWLKRLVFLAAAFALGWVVYSQLIGHIARGNYRTFAVLALWAFTAYIVLPYVHRALTKFYLPDYFIGRVRSFDGLLGDPVNLAFNGSREGLVRIFTDAGWTIAEPITPRSVWRMIASTLLKRSYKTAPVYPMYLFGEKHDIAFQMEENGNPRARHHVRFWRTPDEWWLPGGTRVDWVGAATYDRNVGISIATGQFTHYVSEDTDAERDFIWQSLDPKEISVAILPHFMTAFRARTGRGDSISTDGALVILTAKSDPTPQNTKKKKP